MVIQRELFSLALRGDLLVEFGQFIEILTDKLQIEGKYLLLGSELGSGS